MRTPKSTRAALEDLDRVFHEKARLGIMTTLVGSLEGLNFNELKALCDLTDGNLNRHLKVLVDTGILRVEKTGKGRTTNSLYRITPKGQSAFERYLQALETILNAAKQSATALNTGRKKTGSKKTGLDDGLAPAT